MGYSNAPFQRKWYELLQPINNPQHFSPLPEDNLALKEYHIEAPKKHSKSQCVGINYVSWFLGNHPDLHVLIVSKTSTLAEQTVAAITDLIEKSPKYFNVFGELKPHNPRKWTGNEIYLKRPRLDDKFPSLYATGLHGSLTGGGFDLILVDDPIDEEDCITELSRERARTWLFKVVFSLVFPWSGKFVIGTRWHYSDFYTSLIKESAEYKPWPHQILKAIIREEDKAKGIEPVVLWPEVWNYERLCRLRNEIGTVNFNCLYQNDPTGMEGDLLKASWLQNWENPPPANCEMYAGVDPSLGESDYFGIATLAYDRPHNQGYLVDVWAEHMPFPDILKNKLPELHRTYKYLKIYMETNFWQKILTYLPEMRGLPIVPVKTVANKEQRFIPMSSHFQSGRVKVNPLLNSARTEFFNEWVQFPRGQHDDALDATELVTTETVGVTPQPWVSSFSW